MISDGSQALDALLDEILVAGTELRLSIRLLALHFEQQVDQSTTPIIIEHSQIVGAGLPVR
jgi:hypothetical protein